MFDYNIKYLYNTRIGVNQLYLLTLRLELKYDYRS